MGIDLKWNQHFQKIWKCCTNHRWTSGSFIGRLMCSLQLQVYRDFFRLNQVFDFQRLSDTCTYFRGCPINRLDVAIAYDLPELVGKFKKQAERVVEAAAAQGKSWAGLATATPAATSLLVPPAHKLQQIYSWLTTLAFTSHSPFQTSNIFSVNKIL